MPRAQPSGKHMAEIFIENISKSFGDHAVLKDLSEEYTEDVEHSVDRMIGIIEPTLVGITAFVIGGILLTVMLPLLGIMSSIG